MPPSLLEGGMTSGGLGAAAPNTIIPLGMPRSLLRGGLLSTPAPPGRRQPVYLRLDFPHLRRISGCRGFVGPWITKSAKARENHEIPFAPFVQFRALRDPNTHNFA